MAPEDANSCCSYGLTWLPESRQLSPAKDETASAFFEREILDELPQGFQIPLDFQKFCLLG